MVRIVKLFFIDSLTFFLRLTNGIYFINSDLNQINFLESYLANNAFTLGTFFKAQSCNLRVASSKFSYFLVFFQSRKIKLNTPLLLNDEKIAFYILCHSFTITVEVMVFNKINL